MIVGRIGVGRQTRCSRKLSVESEQTLLGTPVIAQHIGGDPVEPGTQRPDRRLVAGPPPVRRRERIRGQVLGEIRANAPADKPVHRSEMLPEGDLEVRVIHDAAGRSLFPVHTYVLSAGPDPLRRDSATTRARIPDNGHRPCPGTPEPGTAASPGRCFDLTRARQQRPHAPETGRIREPPTPIARPLDDALSGQRRQNRNICAQTRPVTDQASAANIRQGMVCTANGPWIW